MNSAGQPVTPAPVPPAGNGWKDKLASVFRTLAGPLLLAAVPAFLLYAQGQVKDWIDHFLGDCLFVVSKELSAEGHVLVTGHLSGTPPKSLPLVFEGHDATLNVILVDDAYQQDIVHEPLDLAFHPLVTARCPGELCAGIEESAENHMLPVTLTDLHRVFTYRFRVRATPYQPGALSPSHVRVYALFESGLPNGACRVQSRDWRNFWVWAGPVQKFLLFAAVIVGATLLIRAAGKKEG